MLGTIECNVAYMNKICNSYVNLAVKHYELV